MKIGGFYEHQIPRPWTRDSEHKLFKDALDQVELLQLKEAAVIGHWNDSAIFIVPLQQKGS